MLSFSQTYFVLLKDLLHLRHFQDIAIYNKTALPECPGLLFHLAVTFVDQQYLPIENIEHFLIFICDITAELCVRENYLSKSKNIDP